jgi:hypothetical protein
MRFGRLREEANGYLVSLWLSGKEEKIKRIREEEQQVRIRVCVIVVSGGMHRGW